MSRYELCKFTPAPDPELICGICMNVLDTPYETPCHHVFCRECIVKAVKENKKCPICRARCREKQCKEVLPLVQNLINKLTMRCDNFDNGCTDLILKEFFLDHVKSCEYAMVQCQYKQCGQYLLKRDCEKHELNTCAYRDHLCDNGCGLRIPMENINSHNCMEALVALVKDLKEKNLDLQKRVDQLQQAPVSIAKSESLFAPGSSQRDDDNWSSYSITNDDNSSLASYDASSSFSSLSSATNIATDDDSSVASRIAWYRALLGSDQSVGHSDESDQSDTNEIQGNDNSVDYENADRSLENGETNDGHNTDVTPGNQVVDEMVNVDDSCHSQSANSAIDSNVVALEVSSLAASESCESPFVLDYSSSRTSPKTTTGCVSASTDKRQREDDSGFCDDNNGRTQSKRIKTSRFQQHINTQNEEATLASTSLFASNTSNIQLLEGAKKHPYGHKTDKGCNSAVDVSGGFGLLVADEVATALPLTSNNKISQNCHTSSSESVNTVNSSSTIINNDNRLRRGPVTRSRGQNLLDGAKKHPYGHKTTDEGCHSAVDVSGGLGLSVADEVAIPLPLTSNTEISQNCHTSSSESAITVNSSSTIINNGNCLRRGPVTRSRGQDLHIELEDNAIPYVKVPPSFAYLLDRYAQEDDSSDDESWSPSKEN
ncbi:hypothetical protein BsWGS_05937 [Bradybaena similaris]